MARAGQSHALVPLLQTTRSTCQHRVRIGLLRIELQSTRRRRLRLGTRFIATERRRQRTRPQHRRQATPGTGVVGMLSQQLTQLGFGRQHRARVEIVADGIAREQIASVERRILARRRHRAPQRPGAARWRWRRRCSVA